MNQEYLLDYREDTKVLVDVANMSSLTLYYKLDVDPKTKALRVTG